MKALRVESKLVLFSVGVCPRYFQHKHLCPRGSAGAGARVGSGPGLGACDGALLRNQSPKQFLFASSTLFLE